MYNEITTGNVYVAQYITFTDEMSTYYENPTVYNVNITYCLYDPNIPKS